MEVFVQNLAKHQIDQGHQCFILTNALPGLPGKESAKGCVIQRLPFQQAIIERSIKGLKQISGAVDQLLAEFLPDIVHLHTSQASAFFYTRIPADRRPPTIYTAHDGLMDEIHTNSSLLSRILSTVDKIATPSEYIKTRLSHLFPNSDGKLGCIYNSLPPHNAPPSKNRNSGSNYILALGRLVSEKGFDVFLQAMAKVHATLPEIKAVIAGDGPEARRLHQLADSLGINTALQFTGGIKPETTYSLIENASIVVVPSLWQEPFGLVALQAMQQGRPVVASRVGGLPEIVDHGNTGFLVAPGDSDGLAKSLVELVKSKERAIEFGRNGFERAATKFLWLDCVNAYQKIYEDLSH